MTSKEYMYGLAENRNEYKFIDKLCTLKSPETFWDGVRRFTKNVKSDRVLRRYSILAEIYERNFVPVNLIELTESTLKRFEN